MDKTAFIADLIKRNPDFPFVQPITLDSAQTIIDMAAPPELKPVLTATEVQETWNRLINDPDVTG